MDTNGPLTWKTYVGYGYGGICQYIWGIIFGFFMTPFLLQVAQINPFVAGTLQLFIALWTAIINPVIGILSDRTPHPRRKSWIAASALPFCYFFAIFWVVPTMLYDAWLSAYYMIVYFICATAFMAFVVPYNSLSAELTPNYDERTKLSGIRWVISLAIGTVAVAVQSVLVYSFKYPDGSVDLRRGYAVAGGVMGTFLLTPCIVLLLAVKEKKHIFAKTSTPILTSLKSLLNGPFILVLLINSACWSALTFLTNNLILYVTYVIQKEKFFPIVLMFILGICTVCLPIWTLLSVRIGKKKVYFIGTFILVVCIFPTTFLPNSKLATVLIFLLAGGGGIGLGVLYLIPYSMVPDIIEIDELKTGERREGLYFSIFIFCEKLSLGISLAISSYILGLSGFDAQLSTQSENVLLSLRLLVGTFPCIVLILSWIACFFYPITKQKHLETLEKLEFIRTQISMN